MIKNLLIVILLALFSPSLFAVVDMKNANYADTWTDLIIPGSGYDLRVRRTYNSRSLFNGVFGFGWCSDFETKLTITAEGNIKTKECGGGLEVVFTKKNFKSKKTQSIIKQIITSVKKKNRSISLKELRKLERDLNQDDVLRDAFAARLNMKGQVASGSIYRANGREVENIVLKGNHYLRTLEDGTFEKYNLKGYLTHKYDKNGNYLKVKRSGPIIKSIVDNNGRQLHFTYRKNKNKVSMIKGPNGLKSTYAHDGEDLVSNTNQWKNTYKYAYDKLHNMIRTEFPDKSFESITYDKDRDWVTSFKNRKGCIEKYVYTSDKKDPFNKYSSTVTKKCGDKVVNKSLYSFVYKYRNKRRYLYQVKSNVNGRTSEVIYHSQLGKPTSNTQNGFTTTYQYYKNGLVKEKRENRKHSAFEYKNKCHKVSRATIKYFARRAPRKKGQTRLRLAKKTTTRFKYNKRKCNLVYARNDDGQLAKISYDSQGRISKITDQSKKTVRIKYESRFGKPSIVSRPGLGSIKVSYKKDGSIKKVDSKDGPRVAIQVANIFNNLLEIISPATSELSL